MKSRPTAHDLEIMVSNPVQVELGVHSTSVLESKISIASAIASASVNLRAHVCSPQS